VHLHEIHIHEERLGVLGVLLDVSDSRIGLPNIELMQIVVVDAGDLGRGFACGAFPLEQIDDLLILVPIGGVEFREPGMGEAIRVVIRIDARIVGGELFHFIEAIFNRVELGLITQMPLAREVRAKAVLLEELARSPRRLTRPGTHKPPHFRDVPHLMDQFISSVHENLYNWTNTELAAYGLWRLNWIHPFIEGNGRTARAACYYLLCVRSGGLIGGRKIVPERIRENRRPYYAALQAADRAWEMGNLDFSDMEDYLAGLVQEQVQDDNGLPPHGDVTPISN
jgi:hypothetical protein